MFWNSLWNLANFGIKVFQVLIHSGSLSAYYKQVNKYSVEVWKNIKNKSASVDFRTGSSGERWLKKDNKTIRFPRDVVVELLPKQVRCT